MTASHRSYKKTNLPGIPRVRQIPKHSAPVSVGVIFSKQGIDMQTNYSRAPKEINRATLSQEYYEAHPNDTTSNTAGRWRR